MSEKDFSGWEIYRAGKEKESKESFRSQEKLPTQEIWRQCENYHQQFDREKGWVTDSGEKLSYHNDYHVGAMRQAGLELLVATDEGQDPLHLKSQLEKWNQLHPEADLSWEEFKQVFDVASSCHDLGNIAEVGEDGHLQYLENYRAKGAEDRSQELATVVLKEYQASGKITEEDVLRMLPLVQHLIGETTFMFNEEEEQPFDSFMRCCDQLGNVFFNQDAKGIEVNLAREMIEENGDESEINPKFSYNFEIARYGYLLRTENPKDFQEILDIWDQKMPTERIVVTKEMVSESGEKKTVEIPIPQGKVKAVEWLEKLGEPLPPE